MRSCSRCGRRMTPLSSRSCSYGRKCKNSHDLDSDDNRAVLCSHGLQELEDAELFTLLLQNDSSSPGERSRSPLHFQHLQVCSHYNKGNGEHGSCRFKGGCKGLHVCQHFLQGDCTFGDKCKRAHAFDANAQEILKRRGVSPEKSQLLCTIYRNMFAISGPQDGPAGLCVPTADLCLGAGSPPVAATAPPAARERSRQPSSASVSEADRNEICLFFLRRH
ncbi:hypothetical protein COCON_G00230800 [Conger conger]|uniref:C3H1-type domain-containing protein n=1 Tax=Conger conger TaxID=82655 RepID=A0A9Q1CVG7_CONCO|nr:hypothetical protein COCON_G00230800 [Conger conger]